MTKEKEIKIPPSIGIRFVDKDVEGIKKCISGLQGLASDQSEIIAKLETYLEEIARDGYSRDLGYDATARKE